MKMASWDGLGMLWFRGVLDEWPLAVLAALDMSFWFVGSLISGLWRFWPP